jgi:hypothetical protein
VTSRLSAVDKRIDDLRADMIARFSAMDKRIDDLRADMNQRFGDMNQRLTTLTWVISAWFTFLSAVLTVFGFLRFR